MVCLNTTRITEGIEYINSTEIQFTAPEWSGIAEGATENVLVSVRNWLINSDNLETPIDIQTCVQVLPVDAVSGFSNQVGLAIKAPAAEAVVPSITQLAPSTGSIDGGEPIEITGSDFQEDAIVYFGASRGSIVSISEDRTVILATSPAASEVGTVNVTVVNEDDATTSNAKVFAYVIYAPEVLSILPNTGTTSAANTIAIEGTGFRANDDNTYPKVRFLGDTTYEATAVQFLNTGRVLATTPADMDEGYYNVQIENADGQTANSATTLHLQTPQGPAPVVDSITPSSGLLNESKPVEISGSYFSTDPLPTITINGAELHRPHHRNL